jgi:hypothetical protein
MGLAAVLPVRGSTTMTLPKASRPDVEPLPLMELVLLFFCVPVVVDDESDSLAELSAASEDVGR